MYQLITKILTDFHIIATLIFIVISLKWEDWKNWKRYYPTILFFATGNLIYSLLTYNYSLWEYESPLLKSTVSNLLVTLICFPAVIIMYLYHIPRGILKQVLWVIFWIFLGSSIETVANWLGFFSYHNGWNIWWSVLFNFCIYPLLWLHYKKPASIWYFYMRIINLLKDKNIFKKVINLYEVDKVVFKMSTCCRASTLARANKSSNCSKRR